MSFTKGFIIKDIIEYELPEDVHILEEFSFMNTDVILDCLMMGNKCSLEDACKILKQAREKYELTEIIEMLVEELIGKKADKSEKTSENKKIKKLSDILLESYAELQTFDNRLNFETFLNMDTRMLWKYADTVKQIYKNNENKLLQGMWAFTNIFFGAFTGKLKECPVIGEDKNKNIEETMKEQLKALNRKRGAVNNG